MYYFFKDISFFNGPLASDQQVNPDAIFQELNDAIKINLHDILDFLSREYPYLAVGDVLKAAVESESSSTLSSQALQLKSDIYEEEGKKAIVASLDTLSKVTANLHLLKTLKAMGETTD